jgi:hypothetical protein
MLSVQDQCSRVPMLYLWWHKPSGREQWTDSGSCLKALSLSHEECVCVCVWYYCVCVCLYIVVMFNREHTQTITTITSIAPTSWYCQLYPSIFNHIATNRTNFKLRIQIRIQWLVVPTQRRFILKCWIQARVRTRIKWMRYCSPVILLVILVLQSAQILKLPSGQSHASISGISSHPNIQPSQASEQAVLRIWFRDPVIFDL